MPPSDTSGAGNGFVDVFALSGKFRRAPRLHGTQLNSPWGWCGPSPSAPSAATCSSAYFGTGHISWRSSSRRGLARPAKSLANQPEVRSTACGVRSAKRHGRAAWHLFFTAATHERPTVCSCMCTIDRQQQTGARGGRAIERPGARRRPSTGAPGLIFGAWGTKFHRWLCRRLCSLRVGMRRASNVANPPPQRMASALSLGRGKLDGPDFGGGTTVIALTTSSASRSTLQGAACSSSRSTPSRRLDDDTSTFAHFSIPT